ncbi:RadC family protein [Paenibacillus sp. FSL L8-0641]|uniref:RadC family protein n=1 Tax=Paenibacillus sp. FSL L8-0641 TaxID=2921605 RepID=UPI0030FA9E2C
MYNEKLRTLISTFVSNRAEDHLIEELLFQFPTLTQLMNATEQQLISIKGIKHSKARQIMALLQLANTLTLPESNPYFISHPRDVYNLLGPEFRFSTKEHFICLLLNTKNRVIYKEIVSIGSLNSTVIHPREVFSAAIRHCSASIVCVHNHPSGDPKPSEEDIMATKRLAKAGDIIGIDILDHVIIGESTFYSIKEHGHF